MSVAEHVKAFYFLKNRKAESTVVALGFWVLKFNENSNPLLWNSIDFNKKFICLNKILTCKLNAV
jgi:hypothetical protein